MIKTLIFDFGDVFINLDKEATVKHISKRFGAFSLTSEIDSINNQYETGQLSTKDFIAFYKDYFKTEDEAFLVKAWNSIILDFPEYRLNFIKSLAESQRYKLILLSNTNALHIEKVIENMSLDRYMEFKSCFDKFYLSHEIGSRKPDTAIFQFVIAENNLKVEECFYIEDTAEHTISAFQLGIRYWNIIPGKEDVVLLFKKYQHLFTT